METLLFITSGIFLASSCYFHNRLDTVFNRTTKGILFTAATIYSFMGFLYATNPYAVIRAWRYLDWFITVPLLLSELYLFLDVKLRKQKDLILIITLSIIMLGLGLLGELKYLDKWLTNLVGSLSMGGIFYILYKKIPKQHIKFLTTIIILWLFYPMVYLVDDTVLILLLFSIVDLLAKVGTAFYIKSQEKYL
jgi:bacteriorhodopsin